MTRLRRPARRRHQPADAGLTLVELSVVMVIFSLVMVIVFSFLNSIQTSSKAVSNRNAGTSEAQQLTEVLSRQLHAAAIPTGFTSAIASASANEVVLYSSLGNANGPTELDIKTAVPSGCSGCGYYDLVEVVTQPTLNAGVISYNSAGSQTVLLGTGVVLPTPTSTSDCSTGAGYTLGIFEYFNSAGTCLSLTGSPATLGSPSQVENIIYTITTVDTQFAKTAPTTTFTGQVTLPNVDYIS